VDRATPRMCAASASVTPLPGLTMRRRRRWKDARHRPQHLACRLSEGPTRNRHSDGALHTASDQPAPNLRATEGLAAASGSGAGSARVRRFGLERARIVKALRRAQKCQCSSACFEHTEWTGAHHGGRVTAMPRRRVAEVLACLEAEFSEFAAAFVQGEYLLWLGSGISREVVPDVNSLLERVLELLRAKVDGDDPACRFRLALDEVLEVAGVPTKTLESIDLTVPVEDWPAREDIIARLNAHYSEVLDVQVRGEPEDFLVWTGLNVPSTYGDPDLEPDVEHYCIAILMLEGTVRAAPTTNWDGLVEEAIARLAPGLDGVARVVVRTEDFRAPEGRSELIKFHGCAVRARANEHEYRSLIVARMSQISGWTTKPENQMMKHRLEHLFAARPALIVGLSAQDANIHTVFHQAIQNLQRPWPSSPPAVVFSAEQLGHQHRHVLKVAYGDSYSPNADAIYASSLLGAYAKPALLGLVLLTLAEKLCALFDCVPELTWAPDETERLRSDVRTLRDFVGEGADGDRRAFVEAMVDTVNLALSVFREGRGPGAGASGYQPISVAPIAVAVQDPDYPKTAFGRLGVALSLIARGHAQRLWKILPGSRTTIEDGVIHVITERQDSNVFFVRDARASMGLELDGVVDAAQESAVVIQAEVEPAAATRSPRARYGRTGKTGIRRVNIAELCTEVQSADELFEAFKLAGAFQ